MALENVFQLSWPIEKSQLSNPLTSDVIITLSSEAAEEHIPDLLKALAGLDSAEFSLVVFTQNSHLAAFPDSVNAVPSLQEAYDIIEMERIERDLGF